MLLASPDQLYVQKLVRCEGFEPPRPKASASRADVSANSIQQRKFGIGRRIQTFTGFLPTGFKPVASVSSGHADKVGAGYRSRTCTGLLPVEFESTTSANSSQSRGFDFFQRFSIVTTISPGYINNQRQRRCRQQ
jgi:hypothetical protein